MCNFARCDSHPGVCNKLMTVYVARFPFMIGSSLSSTLDELNAYSEMSIALVKSP